MMPQNELESYLQQLTLPGLDNPRPTNRGVINPHSPIVFSHLDYLAVRWEAPRKWGRSRLSIPFLSDVFRIASETNGIKNYRYGANLYPAGRYYWNTERDKLPGYLVLGGNDLAIVRDVAQQTDDKLLALLMPNAHGVTRLDFAVNINRGHPREALAEWQAGRVKTRIKNAQRIDQHGKRRGYTVYFGSPASERFIRCYDKAAELKISNEVLTRIEQQIGKQPAHTLAREMTKHGVKKAGKASMRQYLMFPELSWWTAALGGEDIDMQLKPAKETSFAKWLNEQVYPAIEKRYIAGEELPAIAQFWGSLAGLFGELQNDGDSTASDK